MQIISIGFLFAVVIYDIHICVVTLRLKMRSRIRNIACGRQIAIATSQAIVVYTRGFFVTFKYLSFEVYSRRFAATRLFVRTAGLRLV